MKLVNLFIGLLYALILKDITKIKNRRNKNRIKNKIRMLKIQTYILLCFIPMYTW